jgi:RpiR family carbohydrate utilization transcriptional regulator
MAPTDLPPTRATPVNVIEATRAAYSELRKSERKVADVFLADPRRMLRATLAQAAELARVSQPTVIRFCVAIGCSGFQEFNLRLAHSLALGTPATHSALSAEDDLGSVIEKVFDYTITSLDYARNHLDIAAIEFSALARRGSSPVTRNRSFLCSARLAAPSSIPTNRSWRRR